MKWKVKRGRYQVSPKEKRTVDGILFDSQKEAQYQKKLKLLKLAGDVSHWHRQVIFDLPGNTKYRVDFQVFWSDGTVRYIDVKGHRTKEFIRAKKQVEALYPVEIEEV